MAIREKLRKTFGKSKSSGSGDSTPSSTGGQKYYTGRTDIEYYRPHEIPRPKYRGKIDPEHKDKLEAYSFTDAFTTFRRRSSQALSGIYSPGGTKSMSRRTSWISRGSRASLGSAGGLSGPASDADGRSLRRKSTAGFTPANAGVNTVDENPDDDTDVVNTGLSRQGTVTDTRPARRAHVNVNVPTLRLQRTATVTDDGQTASFDQHFTAEELERAMTRATLKEDESSMARRMSVAAH